MAATSPFKQHLFTSNSRVRSIKTTTYMIIKTISSEPKTKAFLRTIVGATASTLFGSIVLYSLGFAQGVPPVDDITIFKGGFEDVSFPFSPVADAGTNMVVLSDSSVPVILNGERSFDLDGKILSSTWLQTSGPTVIFGEKNGLTQAFVVPHVETETKLGFQLEVVDNDGQGSFGFVDVTVIPSWLHLEFDVLEPSGVWEFTLMLFDQNGTLLEELRSPDDDLERPNIFIREGAGVYYAVVASEEPFPITLTVNGPNGLNLISNINPSEMDVTRNDMQISAKPWLVPFDFNGSNPLGFLLWANDGSGAPFQAHEHPQIIEIQMPHPEPGLRDPDRFLAFLNHQAIRFQEDENTAQTYYEAVDPNSTRMNFDQWLALARERPTIGKADALYQNDADLGFGRDMHVIRNIDGDVFAYVKNFPSLLHAEAHANLIATVAMEWGYPEGVGGDRYTKFFVFGPDGERLLSADLDGRGQKFVPGVCNVCHGGTPKPTFRNEAGNVLYPDNGDTNAQFLPWDLDTFNFFLGAHHRSRAKQEDNFFQLNQLIKTTYPVDPGAVTGNKWTGAAARELMEGWYAGGEVFDGLFVPEGWKDSPETQALYLDVVGPNCRACHITRGTDKQNAIDFSSYAKFIAYKPLIRDLVFEQGTMPLASRTFGHFWNGREFSPAAKLAAFLNFADLVLPSGGAVKPGRPIAKSSMLSDTPPGVMLVKKDSLGLLLDGRDSRFAENSDWQVATTEFGVESVTQLNNQAITKPEFVPESGARMVREIAPAADVNRFMFERAEQDLEDSVQIDFLSDIEPMLASDCAFCHKAGGIPGIPVFFESNSVLELYRDVLDRINFENHEQSLMLSKPGGMRHGYNADSSSVFGAPVAGWEYFVDAGGDRKPIEQRSEKAKTFTRWIQAGAPLGGNADSLKTLSCQIVNQDIPDNDAGGFVNVVEIGPAYVTTFLQLELELEHEYLNDLTIELTNLETGKTSTLLDRPIGVDNASCTPNKVILEFSQIGTVTGEQLCESPNDSRRSMSPVTPMEVFNGDLLNGRWQLTVTDHFGGNTGRVREWCVRSLRLQE
jgi:mono/diheme cytochrome c family protein